MTSAIANAMDHQEYSTATNQPPEHNHQNSNTLKATLSTSNIRIVQVDTNISEGRNVIDEQSVRGFQSFESRLHVS